MVKYTSSCLEVEYAVNKLKFDGNSFSVYMKYNLHLTYFHVTVPKLFRPASSVKENPVSHPLRWT